MPTAHGNGIDIEYETGGDPADPAMLLVMGLGAQMISWPDEFVAQLAAHGFFTIRYDNRDSGLTGSAPYLIDDMADDAIALLDELGVDRAHVVGASMGGMITQALVINHPARFLSACSIMSTTGDRSVGAPTGGIR